jgi:hypothetical protein
MCVLPCLMGEISWLIGIPSSTAKDKTKDQRQKKFFCLFLLPFSGERNVS